MSTQVDSKVPRAKAVFHAMIPALAFLAGPPVATYVLAVTGLIMAASVIGGGRFSLFGIIFNKWIRPALRLGPGKLEEVAPHRFAEAVGSVFLLASSLAFGAGAKVLGESLALIVVALAILNAAAGICVGCQMYLLIKRAQSKVLAS
ncbi:MAG: DUF4395 domain-containing protein [Actinomycetota bacterium]|nr:DUF4395 domain-containing protein [Actinomycetota bacterium]